MLNQCNFIGRITKDIELKYLASGDAVCSFSVACSESWKDKSGQKQERTEFVNCTAFKKLAEIIAKYNGKGDLLYVSGKMQTRKWQDRDGNDRYSTEIIVNDMKMLSSKKDGAKSEPQQSDYAPPPVDTTLDDQEIPF